MSKKPEILFLAHRIPYPPDKGDKIRSWRLFQHLAKRFTVHLACFVDDERDLEHADLLKSMSGEAAFVRLDPQYARLRSLSALVSDLPLTFRYFRNAEMTAFVQNVRKRPLVAEVAFSSAMAPYIGTSMGARKRIVDFCDADSEKWRQYAKQATGPLAWLYRREAQLLAKAETNIASWADASFAVSPEEASIFNRRKDAAANVDWWRNGVDTDYFDPTLPFEKPHGVSDVVFVGAMDYQPNIEGVLQFAKMAWPTIRTNVPEARFAIVGANPGAKIRALDGAMGIRVTGRVDDVRPWLSHSKVVIAPLQIGRGVQNKVLEAMAMAKPIVATKAAITGLDGASDVIAIAESPIETAEKVIELLADADRRREFAAARALAAQNYGWDTGLRRFDAALEKLGLYSSSSPSSSPCAAIAN